MKSIADFQLQIADLEPPPNHSQLAIRKLAIKKL